MAGNIDFDVKDFLGRLEKLGKGAVDGVNKATQDIANEVLRLSSFEVPHDKGLLQNSGNIEPDGDDYIVGYNKVYAARLHEHPEYRFQKGRKGKYLEDPIKNNTAIFVKYYKDELNKFFA